jgi:hypothetical protein
MAQEGIATLPMQGMPAPQESQGIGGFEQAQGAIPEITQEDRFDAVMVALQQRDPEMYAKIQQVLDEANLTPEQIEALDQLIQIIEQDPSRYKEIIQEMSGDGLDPADFPPEYSEEFMVLLKMIVYGYRRRQSNQAPQPVPFARGGIAEAARYLASQGRGEDTVLAHINPAEVRLLKSRGGSGTINPATGLPEFGFLKKIGKAIGGGIKSVVGTVSKILGPELTSIVATVGGFMIGGPAGAAIASSLVAYGQGASIKDALISGAVSYVGASYGPVAGAVAGGVGELAKGGSLKDAIKTAAISGAMSYGTQQMGALGSQGMAPEGTDLSRMGSLDASGKFVPDSTVATPNSVSGVNPSGTGTPVLTPNTVSANNLPRDFDFVDSKAPPPSPGISNVPTQVTPNASATPNAQPPGFFSRLGEMIMPSNATTDQLQNSDAFKNARAAGANYDQAIKAAENVMNPGVLSRYGPATALGIGAMSLAGGFKSEPATPPGMVNPGITGETLVGQNPNKYITQGMPGVRYTAEGNIDRTGTGTIFQPNPAFQQSQTFATPQYGANTQPNYPTYTPPMNAAAPMAGNPVPQPYNTVGMYDFMPSNQPRYMADGGIASFFAPGQSVMQMNRGGYPRKTGQISGPGTGTSDDIPAMLSDGEFVVTAKAVKGVGNGSRREGAKKLYRMMHAMEKKAGGRV